MEIETKWDQDTIETLSNQEKYHCMFEAWLAEDVRCEHMIEQDNIDYSVRPSVVDRKAADEAIALHRKRAEIGRILKQLGYKLFRNHRDYSANQDGYIPDPLKGSGRPVLYTVVHGPSYLGGWEVSTLYGPRE